MKDIVTPKLRDSSPAAASAPQGAVPAARAAHAQPTGAVDALAPQPRPPAVSVAPGPSPAAPQQKGHPVDSRTVVLQEGKRQDITLRRGQGLTLELSTSPSLPGIWRCTEAPSQPVEKVTARAQPAVNKHGIPSRGGSKRTTQYAWSASALQSGGAAFRLTLARLVDGQPQSEAGVDVRVEG